jgi:hypothetical protein
MPLTNGSEVFLAVAVAHGHDGKPFASVRPATVLDADNAVFKTTAGVEVIDRWTSQTWHYTEAAAWRHCADVLSIRAREIEAEAEKCMKKAGAAIAGAEVVTV